MLHHLFDLQCVMKAVCNDFVILPQTPSLTLTGMLTAQSTEVLKILLLEIPPNVDMSIYDPGKATLDNHIYNDDRAKWGNWIPPYLPTTGKSVEFPCAEVRRWIITILKQRSQLDGENIVSRPL